MEKTIEIIRNYATDTESLLDTAIMLNGTWGSGKTYFVKKKLIPDLEGEKSSSLGKIWSFMRRCLLINIIMIVLTVIWSLLRRCCITNIIIVGMEKLGWFIGSLFSIKKKEKIRCAYVSLNGVKLIDEISYRILLSYFGSDTNTENESLSSSFEQMKKTNYGLTGNIARDFVLVSGGFMKDFIISRNIKNRLLIVDDLERVSNELSMKEVLGYFNSYFIEKNGQKVLFVCEESKIGDKEDYQRIKEKTISWTIEYDPKFEDCFDSVTDEPSLVHHRQFFKDKENKMAIMELYKTAKIKNLRIVIKITEIFNRIMGDKDESIDNDIALRLYRMIAMLVNETSSGQELINDADTINYMVKCNISIKMLELTPKGEPDVGKYLIALNGKYFKDNESRWLYLKSVHNYITDHYYDKAGILEEIKNLKTPAIEAYSRFDNIYSFETEEEVQQAIIGLKDHILNDGYSPSTLYRIFCDLQDKDLEVLDQTNIKSVEGYILDQFEKLVDAHTDSIELQKMYKSIGARQLIGKFAEKIQPIYDAKLLQLEKSGVKQLLEAPDIRSYPLVITIMSGKFFTQIIAYNYADCVYNMSVSNLWVFGIALSKVGALYTYQPDIIQKEIDSIKTLIDGFKKHLDGKKWKRQAQEKFIADLESYWKYLEGRINNQEEATMTAENKDDGTSSVSALDEGQTND